MTRTANFLDRYEPQRRPFEVALWLIYFLINGTANSLTVIQDIERTPLPYASREAATWETSSALAALLLIVPIVWLARRCPLQWRE